MFTPRRVALMAALCCGLTASLGAQSSIPTTMAGGGPERTTALNGRIFRALIHPMNGTTVTGTVAMIPGQQMGTTTVTVSLVGVNPGTYYWHIHVGSCKNPGTLLGERSQYQPIQVDESGRATVQASLSVPPPSGGNYQVILHKTSDPKDEGHVVACGELLETGV